MDKLKYSKFKNDIRTELTIFSTLEEKIEYLINIQSDLKKLRSNSKKDIKLEKEIEYLNSKIYRLKKVASKPETLEIKEPVKIVKKVKHVLKDTEDKLDEESIEELKEKMKMGASVIAKEPFEYIEALSLYIQSIDVPLNYNNIKYYIEELKDYFNNNNTSIIAQRYYIKYLIDRLKKIKPRIPKEEVNNREELKKVIDYLENYEYEKLTIVNVNITYVNPNLLEQSLIKVKVLSKLQKTLEIYDDEEFLILLLNYLENNVGILDNDYVGNKYISKILDYISENILELDSEFFPIFEIKLVNINKRIKNNQNYVVDKGLLSKVKVTIDDILSKLEGYRASIITDNPITTHRMIKYIINDLKDIEILLVTIKKMPNVIDNKIFNETLETYFNVILNSNDHSLIIYYQKVIEVLFKNSNLSIRDISLILNDKMNSIFSKDSFISREDKDYRTALLNQTNMILKKVDGYYYNDLIEPYMNSGYDVDKLSDNIIFTIDGRNAKTKENAFSISSTQRKRNGILEDVYYLTLYTSDMSDYFVGKDFNDTLSHLISSSMNLGSEKTKYSLDEGEVRDVIAFTFRMDCRANIEEIKVTKEKIKVRKNFYYDTLKEDFKNLTALLNNQIIRFYFLGTSIIKREVEKNNKEYDGEYYSNPDNFEKIFSQINEYITIYCNGVLNDYFMSKGFTLIDRQFIASYMKQMRNTDNTGKQVSNFEELLLGVDRMYKSGVIYNASNINYGINRYSKVSAPLREVDSLINQLLAYHYSNCYVDKEEANMINFILDGICDELNAKYKQKQLTKSKKVVKLDKSGEEDTIV